MKTNYDLQTVQIGEIFEDSVRNILKEVFIHPSGGKRVIREDKNLQPFQHYQSIESTLLNRMDLIVL